MTNENHETGSSRCPICDGKEMTVFLRLSGMPAQDGIVHESRQAALEAPLGEIELGVCGHCEYIGNLAYDPAKIQFATYSYSQHHSPQYREHIDAVIELLIELCDLDNSMLLDVGCGEGYFLNRIALACDSDGVGIDPSLQVTDEAPFTNQRLAFIKDFYSDRYQEHKGDLVTCRQVIDELEDPRAFLRVMANALSDRPRAAVYLEMPNARRTFESRLVWNVGYAKRSWFTAASLTELLRQAGLDVADIRTLFSGEYLGIAGRRARAGVSQGTAEPAEVPLQSVLDGFAEQFDEQQQRWTDRVAELRRRGEQMAIWGAGMRGINFLSRFGDSDVFPRIVDINSSRQGSFLAASGYRIDAPESLLEAPPKYLLLTNPTYQDEIIGQLRAMGLQPEIELL